MGWFDDQIKLRKKSDEEAYSRSLLHIANAVTGSRRSDFDLNETEKTDAAIGELLNHYRLPAQDIPAKVKGFEERLSYALRPHGFLKRKVDLTPGWTHDAFGAMIGFLKEGNVPITLLPHLPGRYRFLDASTGEYVSISAKNEDLLLREAYVFYRPFPLKELNLFDLLKYITGIIEPSDRAMVLIATLIVTLVGMLVPRVTYFLYGEVVAEGSITLLVLGGIFLICASIGSLMLGAAKTLITSRIDTKMSICVEAATMMRILSLPANFFKDYGSGELSSRASHVNTLCTTLVTVLLNTGLTSLFSLVYITQIFLYAPGLVVPALLIILATVVFSVLSSLMQMQLSKKQMLLSSKENGMSYAMMTGIQKIKLAGAQQRFFARWGELYAKVAALSYNPPLFLKINGVISTAITLTGTIVMYNAAIITRVSAAEYVAFNSAYGMVSGAFMSLLGMALTAANIRPTFEMARPILKTVPEASEDREILTSISGGVEINNLTFRYGGEGSPVIIDDLSLKIAPGSYVAIVGKTGCGKSTLVRLLLGFEKPQKGGIYYDGRDINTIDLRSLRKNIGVVTQNGKLFAGNIFSNIVIAAPHLTMDEAWEAARIAGIDEDIEQMPMGMNTLISEGGGGISGGQRQRLMIARAVAPRPKLLILDEATSALDNITQKRVSDALDAMKCTRIVVAHRLSTIRQCDRILVFDNGHIVEDGTYDELIANNGFFADLVGRQRM